MHEKFLEVNNIKKSFAGVQALRGVSMEINRGEIRALVGENGCGKSTLIKVIVGVHTPDEGEIIINGRRYQQIHPINAIREGIQVIYQDFSLFPNLSAAENIALNHQLASGKRLVDWKEIYRVAEEAIAKIDVKIDLRADVEDLSVADRQMIAISRALLQDAKLIIMDEPTTALTHKEVKSLFKIIEKLKQDGISILFVSHKLNEVQEISDAITIMRNGKKVADGPASEFDQSKIVYYMTGREIGDTSYTTPARESNQQAVLRAEGLSRRGSFQDISFEIYPGEIVGITGLLGSGRTELASALFGLHPAEKGSLFIDGKPVKINNIQDAIKNGIAYVPEDRLTQGLFLPQSIGKNILASTIDSLKYSSRLVDQSKVEDEITKWVQEMAIATPSPDLPVQSLSGGNQQRVVLAKWLATNPKILILDGPTVGVDVGSKAEIHRIIRELASQGMAVIVISDDTPELLHNCNRILLMSRGRIVEEFPADSLTDDELAQKLTGV